MPNKLKVNLILQALLHSYKPFITNYNLNRIEHMFPELLNEIQEFINKEKYIRIFMLLLLMRRKKGRRNLKKIQNLDPKRKTLRKLKLIRKRLKLKRCICSTRRTNCSTLSWIYTLIWNIHLKRCVNLKHSQTYTTIKINAWYYKIKPYNPKSSINEPSYLLLLCEPK